MRYYFDKIRINSWVPIKQVQELRKIKELKESCKSYRIRKSNIKIGKNPYRTTIEVEAATKTFLNILWTYDDLFSPHRVTYIEATQDTFYKTKKEALTELNKELKTLVKKHSALSFTYDPDKIKDYNLNFARKSLL